VRLANHDLTVSGPDQRIRSTIDGATYTVDNAGNRTAKTDWQASVTSNYGGVYPERSRRDGDNLVEETNSSGAVVTRYSQGLNIDEPLAMLRSATTSFYEADGLGTVTSLTGTAGALAQTYTFDSFGKQTASSGSLTNPFQYTGREFDPETSLYYYRARYYDPSAGRFTSEDPSRFQGGINLYSYVRNSATNYKDPSGLLRIDKSCDCSNFNQQTLQAAASLALAGAIRLSNPGLRNCILSHLINGTIECGGAKCIKGEKPDKKGRVLYGWALPWGKTIHLCKPTFGSPMSVACTMIHELAHTCHHPKEGAPDQAENQAFPGLCP
jgi:RHS repeat-associated protein